MMSAGGTLDGIVRCNARRFPRKAALVSAQKTWSWEALDERVDRGGAALRAAGLARGDRVAVLASNCVEYWEIYFACARAGLIATPLNYRLTPGELAQIIAHAEPGLLICGAEYQPVVRALEARPPAWVIGKSGGETPSWDERLAAAGDAPAFASGDEDDTFAIFFTSGTTGLPKGAMVSHRNLEANGYNQIIADRALGEDINLIATPIYHMGAVFMAISYMMLGCTQVIAERFTPAGWLRALAETRASVSLLVPTMINALLHASELATADLSSLRLIFYGGGPMPPAVLARALAALPCGFTQGYGLTETLEATFLTADDHRRSDARGRARLASAGREALGAEVRILGPDGAEKPAGEVGEVVVRSRSVIAGYWRQPEATRAAIRDGWFHTGDLGYVDDERYLFIVDRLTDMVVSGGVNIYTREIEEALYGHPAVREAAVFGLPDEQWGEKLCAAIVLRGDMSCDEAALRAHCASRLAGFKKPRAFFFMAELPKNPSGKILKRRLRDHFMNESSGSGDLTR